MIGEPVLDGTDSILCSFVPLPERQLPGLFTLTTDRAPKSRIEELGFMISEEAQSQVPGTYLHHMGSHGDNLCHAAVHTVRGRFHVGYGEINPPQSRVGERTESCTIAVQTLESINSKMGETNGAVN
ncbi:hypothetical protein QP028_12175 [Corynebacterium suedekumii]|nr:hypothetical protein QP028_12175 [Corynebacterium suedekumii]